MVHKIDMIWYKYSTVVTEDDAIHVTTARFIGVIGMQCHAVCLWWELCNWPHFSPSSSSSSFCSGPGPSFIYKSTSILNPQSSILNPQSQSQKTSHPSNYQHHPSKWSKQVRLPAHIPLRHPCLYAIRRFWSIAGSLETIWARFRTRSGNLQPGWLQSRLFPYKHLLWQDPAPTYYFISLSLPLLTCSLPTVAQIRGDSKITGTVTFEQDSESSPTTVSWSITGHDANAERGMHVHQFGDNTNGCTSAGPHCKWLLDK
jgi:Copper/zinc superoxide dismutase (SODC)